MPSELDPNGGDAWEVCALGVGRGQGNQGRVCRGGPKQAPLTTPMAFLWRDACVKDLGCLSTDVLFR